MARHPSGKNDGPVVAVSSGAALRIVERVGRRFLIACACGNYFLCARGLAICDQCGAESPVDSLGDGGDRDDDAPET